MARGLVSPGWMGGWMHGWLMDLMSKVPVAWALDGLEHSSVLLSIAGKKWNPSNGICFGIKHEGN